MIQMTTEITVESL